MDASAEIPSFSANLNTNRNLSRLGMSRPNHSFQAVYLFSQSTERVQGDAIDLAPPETLECRFRFGSS
jgi:hypothetical protein